MPQRQCYLIHVEFSLYTPDRLKKTVPAILKFLTEMNGGEAPMPFYRSIHADQCGWFIQTHLAPRQILAAIESPSKGGQPWHPDFTLMNPFLTNQDVVAVVQIGEEFTFPSAKARAGAWLQHRAQHKQK